MTDWIQVLKDAKTVGEALDTAKTGLEIGGLLGGSELARLIVKRIASLGIIGSKEETLHNKTDIPILIQATPRIAVQDCRNYIDYLEKKNRIDAEDCSFAPIYVIGIGKDPSAGGKLNDFKQEEWQNFVRDFHDYIQGIQRIYGSKRYHLFLAAPGALAFTLGASVGHQHLMRIYNHNPSAEIIADKYVHVLSIPKDIPNR